MKPILSISVISAALCLSAAAQNRTWSGNGTDDNWTTAANWEEGTAPVPAGNVTLSFNGTTTSRRSPNNDFAPDSRFFALKNSGAGNFTFTGNRTVLGDAGGGSTIFETLSGGSHVTLDMDIAINEGAATFNMRGGATINGRLTSYITPNPLLTYSFASGRIAVTNPNNSFGQGVDVSGGATLVVSQWIDRGLPSQLGAGNFTKLGNAGAHGTIEYVGPATSTDRTVTLGDNAANATFTGNATIRNNGSGALTFTSGYFNAQTNNTTLSNRTLTLAGNFTGAPNVIQGAITDNNPNAKITLVKSEAGTWQLDGNNTYTGNTTVSGGTLVLNGNCSAATAPLSVAANCTLTGNGTIGGNTTISGNHMPGNGPGVQTFAGALTYSGGAITWQLRANSATQTSPASFDQVFVGGNLDFTASSKILPDFAAPGSEVDWSNGFWASDRSWLLFGVAGTSAHTHRLHVALTDPTDAQGDRLGSIRPRSFFTVRQSGQDVYIDYKTVPLPATASLFRRENGRIVDKITGRTFNPVGFNFIRLNSAGALHHTFAPYAFTNTAAGYTVEAYDGPAATAMFQKLAGAGFNTVRVFINYSVSEKASVVDGSAETRGLDTAYMDNVVDFLQRAREENVFVIPELGFFPATDYYRSITLAPAPANITGNNRHFFDPQYITAKQFYVRDFLNGILLRDPEAIQAVLALDLGNEMNFPVTNAPFNLESGSVQAPNGATYDIATQKTQMADEVAVHWINTTVDAVQALVPGLLTNLNVFSYLAVGRSGPGDFSIKDADWKNRYPWRPRATVQSRADIVDLHLYPDSLADLDAHLASQEWADLKQEADAAGKVLMVGEFGVNYGNFGEENFATARRFAPTFVRRFTELGFQGWLQWTYDTAEQNKHYTAVLNDFAIFNDLAAELPWLQREVWFADDFEGTALAPVWTPTTPSEWTVAGGMASQTNGVGLDQLALTSGTFSDFHATARIKINTGTGWAGINFRKTRATAATWNDGYNLFITNTGQVTLNVQPPGSPLPADITLASYASGIDPTAEWVELTASAVGNRIRVWLNGTLIIDVTDSTYSQGYTSLSAYNVTADFDQITVEEEMQGTFAGWVKYHGPPAPQDTADSDPDGDGTKNLLEYAFGTDPLDASSFPATTLAIEGDESFLQGRLNPRATDCAVAAETCLDLSTWTTAPAEGPLVQEWHRSADIRIAKAPPPPPGGKARFMRFRATLVP